MNIIKKTSALFLSLFVLASCGGNSKSTSDSDSTCTTSCECAGACACDQDPCACHMDVAIDSSTANGEMIAYFNNGTYRFIQLGNDDASSAKLFDADKNEIAKGQIVKEESDDEKLIYSFDNGHKATIFLTEPKMECKHGDEIKTFVLTSPNQEVYTSGNDTITAIYRPEVSVTLITKDGVMVLPQGQAHAKGAEYTDGKTTWSTQMHEATLKNDDKTVEYTTDGKSTLPKVVFAN